VVSLRTRNYREAEHRAELLDGVFHGALARARLAVSQGGVDLNAILRGYLREVLDADFQQRLAAKPGRPVFTSRFDPEQTATDMDLECLVVLLDEAQEALAEREFRTVAPVVDDLMRRHGLPEDARPRLSLGILEAHVRYYDEAIKRTRAGAFMVLPEDVADMPPARPLPPAEASPPQSHPPYPTAPEVPPSTKPLASALVEPFFEKRTKRDKATHQVMNQDRGTLRRFLEVCRDRAVDAYDRGDINGFLDTLRGLPKTYGKSPGDKDRSLADIIAEADAKGAERLTDKTVKRHLSALSQFFRFAMDEGHISNAYRAALVENHRFRAERGARDQRDQWTPDELGSGLTTNN
jgi:hypothetical protein